jgi:hypothetical protein
MQESNRNQAGGLELSRLTLASLAVWLAVTCLVAGNRAPVATATSTAPSPAESNRAGAASPVDLAADPPLEPIGDEMAAAEEVEIPANVRPALIQTTTLAAVAAAPADSSRFVFPEDLGGQLLSAKLIPPARFEVWPVPYVSEPEPWRTLKLDPLPRDISALTRTIIRQEPSTTPLAVRAGLSVRPLDLPGLPGEMALSGPTPIQAVPLPRSYVPSADPNAVPFLAVSPAPPKEKIDPAANPARAAAEMALFRARLLAASLPTAFVKLPLPDPFEQIRAVQFTTKLPDLDPALFPAGQPSRPYFPVMEAPGEGKK